jgi:hypothetical protein
MFGSSRNECKDCMLVSWKVLAMLIRIVIVCFVCLYKINAVCGINTCRECYD